MRVAVRRARDTDAGILATIFLEAMRDAITASRGAWDEARERGQFLGQLDVSATRVIEVDGRPAGFAMVVDRSGAVLLHTICLAAGAQGQGIGSATTRDIVQQAHASGRDVVLSVLKSNPRARALYERLGFAADGESTHHHWMRHTAPVPPHDRRPRSGGGERAPRTA